MKTVCIIQARTTSERFPLKIMAGLGGRPMLAHVLERAAAIRGVDQVVLAVPEYDVRLVNHLWPHVFGGPEKDVLRRYAMAAEAYGADVIIRVTGDCPLLAPDLISEALNEYTHCGYLAFCQPYVNTADGWDAEIFERRVLVNADRYATKDQREHVTTFMRCGGELCLNLATDYTALNCSVNTREDLERVKLIYDHLKDKADFSHTATWQAWEKAGRP